MSRKQDFGKLGEEIAVKHLLKQGYRIVSRNYTLGRGEIDIIAYDGSYLCFIEVKTRSYNSLVCPLYAIDYKKKKQLTKLALMYLKKYSLFNSEARFDVVSVILKSSQKAHVEVIKNAFKKVNF